MRSGIKIKDERLTILAGHYGSGKTNIAVNYALRLKRDNKNAKIAVADLDIVNPYFRTTDSEAVLSENGIRIIASPYAGTNLDAPALSPSVMSIFDDNAVYGIIDLGGDDRGAVAAGRYKKYIEAERSKNILLVINCYRPLSRAAGDIALIKNEIEAAASFKFTGIVNNSNLGAETRAEDIINSLPIADEAAEACSLPVVMTCAEERFKDCLDGKAPGLFFINLKVPAMIQNFNM